MTSFSSAAQAALRTFLHDVFVEAFYEPPESLYHGLEPEVTIHLFDNDSRVSEVGYYYRAGSRGAGSTWMRSEPESLGVILAWEDFMLAFGEEPESWDEDANYPIFDLANESRWRLAFLLAPDGDSKSKDAFAGKFLIERKAPARLPEGLHARACDDPVRIEIVDAQDHLWVTIHDAAEGDPEQWRWAIRDHVLTALDAEIEETSHR